ncbi:hypothetical protein G7054_g6508 [Neopestalotiopsis clavispora]|nr:hypothetical protein G7054_g6508 [Neopestalotiopsis clavispora]
MSNTTTLLSPAQSCAPSTFSNLALAGAEILQIQASVVANYDFDIPEGWRYSQPAIDVQNASFCNVTATYTHTSQNDTIVAETWLPVDGWNGMLQSIGGGGWTAGRFYLTYAGMAGAIHDGFASGTTDGGVGQASSPATWGLVSPGNLNLIAFDDIGQASLGELAVLSKQAINEYYGQAPRYSYWNACSHGGRQASILAQQFPEAYDGIIAAAPGLYWSELAVSSSWPTFYMDLTKQYPQACELSYITTKAIAVCDGLDGVVDGLIAEPELCLEKFPLQDYIGDALSCVNATSNVTTTVNLSPAAADVANATWRGPRFSNGDFMWYGYEVGTDLATAAPTACEDGVCDASARSTLLFWYAMFVLKDLTANITTLSHDQYDDLWRTAKKVFASSMEASEPSIFDFRNAGGKMITYHGLADPSITPGSTLQYYKEVNATVGDVDEFFRYYRVPGLGHCWGGNGGQPTGLFSQLRAWVENGTAPAASPVQITLPDETKQQEIICPFPARAVYDSSCGNFTSASLDCWSCQ